MPTSRYSFLSFANGIIHQLQRNGQHKSWQHYRSTLNSFMRFRHNRDISLRNINSELITSYEAYLKQQHLCRNTTSFYMRILRAIYNRAVDQQLITQQYPFCHVYTGIDKTRKRAITIDTIKRIKHLDTKLSSSCEMARDAFLISFFLRGISFVDLAHLKKSDLRNGYLRYIRSKTGQQITIKWEPQMQDMIDKYHHLTASSPYLFPFLSNSTDDFISHHKLYHNAEMRIRYQLQKIRQLAGITTNLTLYIARHSWATVAHSQHQPIAVISEALGHDSETTTQIYLRSIQTPEVDNLNAKILSELE